jgi:drug/metabolite transporter (DMT)-like permease
MILLAAAAAVLWGSGNFSMGSAVRRSSPRATVITGFTFGLFAASLYLIVKAPHFKIWPFYWGNVAGLAQGLGWLCFARGMSKTSIAVVAPVSATTTTLALLIYSILRGDALSILSASGLLLGLVSLAVFSSGSGRTRQGPQSSNIEGVLYALLAGGFFAAQALALVRAGTDASPVVLVGAGCGVVVILLLTAIVKPIPRRSFLDAAPFASLGGLAIFVGDLSYLYALHRGAPALATVVAQLHPLLTALLAGIILRDHLRRLQVIGVLLAISGVTLIGYAHT